MRMKSYHVNEIFYSLQGEGFWTGRPAVFVRFSGCNLKCPFCDTVHNRSKVYTLDSLCEIVDGFNCNFVVLTGGEPSLSVDDSLVEALHKRNKFLAIETNGTQKLPENIDWITLSPKDAFVGNGKVILERANELKIVFTPESVGYIEKYSEFNTSFRYLQPCDMGDELQNRVVLEKVIHYCLMHPQWILSLQIHKLIGVK